MASISPLSYSLDSSVKVNWSATHEKSISRDFPFFLNDETTDQFVARTYLQFLWLPDSIMPLHLLVPSLLRVNNDASSSQLSITTPHPLHALLEPLLSTVRSTSNKYQVELPQILLNGGGAGEIEETMMWFVLSYEIADSDEARTRQNGTGHAEGPWVDDKWRRGWLERMERREVQVQILLYFLKISLSGPLPAAMPDVTLPKKHKKSSRSEAKPVIPSAEDCLESFMDKLSMWQLMGKLDPSPGRTAVNNGRFDDRDWMQVFCEDIVEIQFKTKLPDFCALLRSKIFPNSPFSEDTSPSSSRSPSPDAHKHKKRARFYAREPTQYPSPAQSLTSTRSDVSRKPDKSRSLARSRSRSLSLSLAQEREKERAGSVGAGGQKRVLKREVSMSMVFKGKEKHNGGSKVKEKDRGERQEKTRVGVPQAGKEMGRSKAIFNKDEGVTLVDATPVKPKARSRSQFTTGGSRSGGNLFGLNVIGEKEEIWNLPSSPDVLMLGGNGSGVADMESDGEGGDEN